MDNELEWWSILAADFQLNSRLYNVTTACMCTRQANIPVTDVSSRVIQPNTAEPYVKCPGSGGPGRTSAYRGVILSKKLCCPRNSKQTFECPHQPGSTSVKDLFKCTCRRNNKKMRMLKEVAYALFYLSDSGKPLTPFKMNT